ncbi:MAG TPA: hypothetical protein VN646_21160 [Candidatus Acidoferrum sp.]|nr:hypothetical protein [Candidatus Acidoferrum sp.]
MVCVRYLSWILALVVLVATPALAQDEDVLRPCRRADLIGFWRVVRFGFASGAAVDRSDPAYQMHQRYVFNSNATMAYSASEVPPTPAEHRALLLAPAPVTWALDAGGHLMRQEAGSARVEKSECRVVTRAVRDPRSKVPVLAGDVLLTDQGEDDRPITRRLLRKVKAGE